jgi:hypothetical protein
MKIHLYIIEFSFFLLFAIFRFKKYNIDTPVLLYSLNRTRFVFDYI